MKKLVAGVLLAAALSLGGCANLQNAWNAVTSANVSPKLVVVAGNAFDAVETTATNYIAYCTPNPAPKGCDDALIQKQIVPAVRSGRAARSELEAFLAAHPGQLGPKGPYDALVAATDTLQQIINAYNLRAAK